MQLRNQTWSVGWLLAAIVTIALPHLLHVRPWISLTLIVIAVYRLLAAEHGWRLPSWKVRIPLVFAALTGVLWSYHRISGVEAGSALLLVMLALKLLETRSPRDHKLIIIICFVLMFAAFLREQAIWSSAYLIAGVCFATVGLLQSGDTRNGMPLGDALRNTARLLLQALPVMALLFVLFPRVPGPFWSLPVQTGTATSGLGDTVNPGDITELGRSDAVAFRVRFDGAVPEPAQRYWRGPVMGYFNGSGWSWRPRGPGPEDLAPLQTDGPGYSYEITLEPHGRRWLLALESPVEWDRKEASFSPDWQLMDRDDVTDLAVYRARSIATGVVPGAESQRHLQAMRHLPKETNPRTQSLAHQLRATFADDRSYLNAVLSMFRNEEFFYTLTPPSLTDEPVDSFLFDSRSGFCEHYASAFAVLARAGGIPARVVTGYLGAELNPMGDYWIVRQSDAHAWTEVWLDGEWHRYDPTAAVAPDRIEYGIDSAIPDLGRSPIALLRRNAMLGQMVLSVDALNAAWDQWVLGFGPDTQRALLARLGIARPGLRELLIGTVIGCGLFLALLAWYLGRQTSAPLDPVQRSYQTFARRLARVFRPRAQEEGPADYARAAIAAHPKLNQEVSAITWLYLCLRYENSLTDSREPATLAELRGKIRSFRPARIVRG
jgi:transglutaminase-like putative cysteine protease